MSHVLEDEYTTPKSGIASTSHLAQGEIFPSESLQQRLARVIIQLDLPYNPVIHLSSYQVKYFQLFTAMLISSLAGTTEVDPWDLKLWGIVPM